MGGAVGRRARLAGSLATGAAAGHPGTTLYAGSYAVDAATFAARLIVPAAALLILGLSAGRVRGSARESEFAVLVLLASLGTILLAGSTDLLLLAVAYLLASIPSTPSPAGPATPPAPRAP